MAEIRPFHGLHYNQSLVSDLSRVICPPYDVISPQLQQELYARSEYNFIRLEFGRELPQDDIGDNRYTRSAVVLEDWLRQDIGYLERKHMRVVDLSGNELDPHAIEWSKYSGRNFRLS